MRLRRTLSHIDAHGKPAMVDVTNKDIVYRTATAEGMIRLSRAVRVLIRDNAIAKGNVLVTAELAGMCAAKKTAEVIPLCHPLQLTGIVVRAQLTTQGVMVTASVRCAGRTGVEMEALTAVSVALLTVYDMCKAVDARMVIGDIRLIEKKKEALV